MNACSLLAGHDELVLGLVPSGKGLIRRVSMDSISSVGTDWSSSTANSDVEEAVVQETRGRSMHSRSPSDQVPLLVNSRSSREKPQLARSVSSSSRASSSDSRSSSESSRSTSSSTSAWSIGRIANTAEASVPTFRKTTYTLTRLNSHHIVVRPTDIGCPFHLTKTVSSTTLFCPDGGDVAPAFRTISSTGAPRRHLHFGQGLIGTRIAPSVVAYHHERRGEYEISLPSGVIIMARELVSPESSSNPTLKRSLSIRKNNLKATIRNASFEVYANEDGHESKIGHYYSYGSNGGLSLDEECLYEILHDLHAHRLIKSKVHPLHSVFEEDDDLNPFELDIVRRNASEEVMIARHVLVGLSGIWGAKLGE